MHTIGWAVKEMKAGNRVCRTGWNGNGMWLMYVDDWEPAGHAGQMIRDHKLVPRDRCPFIAMKTAHGDIVPWLCSQTDLLAADWNYGPPV